MGCRSGETATDAGEAGRPTVGLAGTLLVGRRHDRVRLRGVPRSDNANGRPLATGQRCAAVRFRPLGGPRDVAVLGRRGLRLAGSDPRSAERGRPNLRPCGVSGSDGDDAQHVENPPEHPDHFRECDFLTSQSDQRRTEFLSQSASCRSGSSGRRSSVRLEGTGPGHGEFPIHSGRPSDRPIGLPYRVPGRSCQRPLELGFRQRPRRFEPDGRGTGAIRRSGRIPDGRTHRRPTAMGAGSGRAFERHRADRVARVRTGRRRLTALARRTAGHRCGGPGRDGPGPNHQDPYGDL